MGFSDPFQRFTYRYPSLLKLVRFLAVGIPAFLIAIPLNWWLVQKLDWPKPAAYALVLIVQVTINFFACIVFVFKRDLQKSIFSQFMLFMSGILAARVLDWALYSLLVLWIPYFTAVQLFNVILFSITKFAYAQKVIEGDSPASKS